MDQQDKSAAENSERNPSTKSGPWMLKYCCFYSCIHIVKLHNNVLHPKYITVESKHSVWDRTVFIITSILTACVFCFRTFSFVIFACKKRTALLKGCQCIRDNWIVYIHCVETITLNSFLPCSFKVQNKLNTPYMLNLKHYSALVGRAQNY